MKKKTFSVAIDGPAGAGKSTLARAAAKELGFYYVDTGAIYRAVGYHMWMMGIGPKDADGIRRLLDDVNLSRCEYDDDGMQHMILNGKDVTDEIRTPLMSSYASGVSAQAGVRDFLLDMQRELARRHNVVMDGRDIGNGGPAERGREDLPDRLAGDPSATRRLAELQAKGEKTALEKVLSDMKARDKQDSTRTVAPLRCAPDAVKLDTSEMNLEEARNAILELVRRKLWMK